MRMQNRFGFCSTVIGVVALCIASVATHAKSVYHDNSYVVLKFLESAGLTRHSSDTTASVSALSFFSINDERAIFLLFLLSYFLATCAMILAFVAEVKREDSLYLGVGFICAVLAVARANVAAGLVVMFLSFVGMMILRKRRDAKE